MPKLPPLKDNTKLELQRDVYRFVDVCDDHIVGKKIARQKSKEISQDNETYSPCKKSRRKSLGTPNVKSRGSLKGVDMFECCYLPTITENKREKSTEHNRSTFQKTSLTKLHEKSFTDKKSMAFWRRCDNDSKRDGKTFERTKSIQLQPSRPFDHDTKSRF